MLYVNPMAESYTPQAGLSSVDTQKRQVAVRELEQYFIYTMLQEMRKSLDSETLLDGGREKQMFEGMLDDALSKQMAETGQLGIGKMIEEQLRINEIQSKLQAGKTSAQDARVPGGFKLAS